MEALAKNIKGTPWEQRMIQNREFYDWMHDAIESEYKKKNSEVEKEENSEGPQKEIKQ